MFNLDPTTIKKGDIFYEYGYGTYIEAQAMEDVILEPENDYWHFKALTGRRGVVHYGGGIKITGYNPKLQKNDPGVGAAVERLERVQLKTAQERQLEAVGANIVHQIGDALYDALPSDVAHDYFVTARQATNDVAIDFTKQLITTYAASERVRAVDAAIESICSIVHDLAVQDGLRGSESISPYMANAITIYQEYLKGDKYERIDVSTLGLPTIDKLLKERGK